MSYYSDLDVKRALGKDIVIEPFDADSLTPIGYDFRVGDYVFSLEHGLLPVEGDGSYRLPPKSTVQILTKEALWVSSRLGGTFHSKVSLVSKGLSHISTTLDPLWYGPLLITMRNNMDKPIALKSDEAFVTLVFSRVRTPTKSNHHKEPFRRDILLKQLEGQTQQYVAKITAVLTDTRIQADFAEKVAIANRPMTSKVAASIRSRKREDVLQALGIVAVCVGILTLTGLSFLWSSVSPYLWNVAYDTKVFACQIAGIIALLALLVSLTRRNN